MALIKSFRDVPPGGWRYVQPETAVRFDCDTFEGLVAQVIPHRKYKNLAPENTNLDVQRQICAGLDTTWCEPEPGENYQPVADLTASLTTSMALSLGRAVIAALSEVASGKTPFCPKDEAAARAAVCRGCPFNKPASLCACSAVYKTIEATIPADRRQAGVSVCMACGCSLQAKTNLPLAVVQASNSPDTVFPTWCWQRPAPPLREADASVTTT